jgi:hypothetical protein
MNPVLAQLQVLASLQCDNDLYFTDGLFAAERVWAKGMYHRKDNTAFFTACIGFTLMRYKERFTEEELILVNSMLEKMKPAFEHFRNKDGHASYNFWQTKPSRHFPGGYFARRFTFFMIPDDIDDSAMIHLVYEHTREEQLSLKHKMVRYAIGNLKWPDQPVKGYEDFKSYNTFFVKNMPSAFDVCALCNALYFIYYYQLPLNEQDENSLKMISKCLGADDHLNRPYAMSPYYPNAILIIYHVVRFMIDLKVEELMGFRDKLFNQCVQIRSNKRLKDVEQLLLTICIQKLKPSVCLIAELTPYEKAHFPFFVAGILGEVSPKWLRSVAFSNATHIKYHSIAYAETLWLEHLMLNRLGNEFS